jgi:hypothetical protein
MNRTRGHHVKQNKSDIETYVLYVLSHMWKLGNNNVNLKVKECLFGIRKDARVEEW